MFNECFNDGDILSPEKLTLLKCKGFPLGARDFTDELSNDSDFSKGKSYKINFVGFAINLSGDIMTVFPKKYVWKKESDLDRKKIFLSINKVHQHKMSSYLELDPNKDVSTNYPFSAFNSIYEYYIKYGIHFEQNTKLKPYSNGKVNWKETIRLSQKYICNNKLIIFPIYYNEAIRIDTFLTNCMIFAIDFTIDKFSFFIDKKKTNRSFPQFDFILNKKYVVDNLYSIKHKTFRDINIKLIEDLIQFFSTLDSSGNFYFKHYSFHSVWEEMAMFYLKYHFINFDNKKMILSPSKLSIPRPFRKPVFHPNLANSIKSIQPDHYLEDDSTQYILDAKYYEPIDMDYKQISYLFFLKNRRDKLNKPIKFKNTHSALIIPSTARDSKIHFEIDPLFNSDFAEIVISEERICMNDIIDFWIKS
jgi:hypothetical protein